jgi:transcriptional regulator with GAF, ATPase, and Fis domain
MALAEEVRMIVRPPSSDPVSEQLLRTMSDTLDVREMFPELAAVAMRILPCDRFTISFHDAEGHVALHSATEGPFPEFQRITVDEAGIRALSDPFYIADDLAIDPLPIVDPPDLNARIVAQGFRSMLRVHVQARDERIGLGFWAKRPRAFTLDDVSIAQRVADHVALAVSHEQLAETAAQLAEARARSERLEARVTSLTRELDRRRGVVLGESREWHRVLRYATQVAATDTTVLLNGESGTGKEVVARFIHRASPRRDGPFVALNCAALPEQLLESELFGHERGAFTGALAAKPGQIELASGGVLFLDEVTEMSLSAQSKFLRVLQEREFQRVGGTRTLRTDVRVIAATNRNLRQAVDNGVLREDLYFRLQVFDIRLPPLRERPSDILLLADAFLEDIGRSIGRPPGGLTRDAARALERYAWPGNVRELRNALERASILCDGGLITVDHLGLSAPAPAALSTTPSIDLHVMEQQAIAQVLHDVNGNKSEAARRLGLSRTQLYVRIRKYQLEPA